MCKMTNRLSGHFKNSKGLLQGWPLSPTSLKIYIQMCLQGQSKKCEKMRLEKAPGRYLYYLLFGDEHFVLERDGEYANYMCNKLLVEEH